MGINLTKEGFIDLKKVAATSIEKVGLGNQKAKVALALDISGSMSSLFSNGTVQSVVEKLLALGVKFDDNDAIDIFLFGQNDYEVEELKEKNFIGYVNDRISKKYQLEGGTNYSGVMKRIVDKYSATAKKGFLGKMFSKSDSTELDDPAFVIFVTDGDNFDKSESEKIIREASKQGIFWQFVGLGNSSFNFLQTLDTLRGRYIDNANFFQLNDVGRIGDSELYARLLGEFPSWIKEARNKNLIK